MNSVSDEPLFTNCTSDFIGTLDSIFYKGLYPVWPAFILLTFCLFFSWVSADTLAVESFMELLDEESLRKDTALPSKEWSSDHIALFS